MINIVYFWWLYCSYLTAWLRSTWLKTPRPTRPIKISSRPTVRWHGMHVGLENEACFLHEVTGLGSPTHNRFIACQRMLERGGRTDGDEKMSLNQKQILHKILLRAASLAPTVRPSPHEHPPVNVEGGNGGKHATFDPPDRVTAGPAGRPQREGTSWGRSALTAHFLSRQEVRWITARQTLSPAFKSTQ